MADDLTVEVHFNADGRAETVVFEGVGPDPAVVAELEARPGVSGLADTARQ
jgi:hypothetical protein